ncbi:MAG: hypothetical protein FD176_1393 [Rhodospirillaceae bacterium]|nr:MAG: hypothetical protein FD176_1393 [Rhodospirillaceae bacterium]
MPSWPLDQVLPLAIILPLVGVAAGLIAGLLGVGGGIVVVPVLYHVFTVLGLDEAVRMHVAVGTSLATIIATSTSSWRSHARKGAVDMDLLRDWGPFILVGVALGSLAAGWVKGPILTGIFAVFAFLVALHMAFGRPHWRLGHNLPTGAAKAGLATLIGGCSAMMGIGGGTFAVPTLTLFGTPIHRAVGTASAPAPSASSSPAGTRPICRRSAWVTSICWGWRRSCPPPWRRRRGGRGWPIVWTQGCCAGPSPFSCS